MTKLALKVAALIAAALLAGWIVARAAIAADMHHGVTVAAISEERCADLLARYTRKCVSLPTPTPTAAPSPSPSRTPGPTISEAAACRDGTLNRVASQTDPWFGATVVVPQGETLHLCAPIREPLVHGHPNQITFSWYDVSDQDCGALNIRVDALDPPARTRGGQGWSASGQFVYNARVGSGDNARLTPEQTKPGLYAITLIGGPASDSCNKYRIAWKAN